SPGSRPGAKRLKNENTSPLAQDRGIVYPERSYPPACAWGLVFYRQRTRSIGSPGWRPGAKRLKNENPSPLARAVIGLLSGGQGDRVSRAFIPPGLRLGACVLSPANTVNRIPGLAPWG